MHFQLKIGRDLQMKWIFNETSCRIFDSFVPELIEENVRVNVMGYRENLPDHTMRAVEKAIADTAHCTGLTLNFALNYGGRSEIITAAKEAMKELELEGKSADDLTEEKLNDHLMSSGLGDPDLLIRTSGELRLSNFMLWQLAYSEFYFTDTHWPDFSKEDFYRQLLNIKTGHVVLEGSREEKD